jgi:hypothetical protein
MVDKKVSIPVIIVNSQDSGRSRCAHSERRGNYTLMEAENYYRFLLGNTHADIGMQMAVMYRNSRMEPIQEVAK